MIDHNQIEIARRKFGVSIDVSVAGDENGLSEAAIEIANKYGLSLEEDDEDTEGAVPAK